MKSVCYILSYRSPDYVRTRTLVAALKKIGGIKLHLAINSSKGFKRYFETLWKLAKIRITDDPEFYILGFRGHEIFWPVRIITWGKILIFDQMMSPYDSLIHERKTVSPDGWLAKSIYLYEKIILHRSEGILTDTEIHRDFFQELFEIDAKKILAVPVGADESLLQKITDFPKSKASGKFEVLFYGTFLPLHGIDVILEAAKKLKHLPIHLTLVGGGNGNKYAQLIEKSNLENISHIEWVEFKKLASLIAAADIGLGGPFGNTKQGLRVITGKTMQFLAMSKPVIIGNIPQDNGFLDKFNCLMIEQGDPDALANTIQWAFEHQPQLPQIGANGLKLYQDQFSIEQISKRLTGIFQT